MKLRNKIINRARILIVFALVVLLGLWAMYYGGLIPYFNGFYKQLLPVLSVLMIFFLIIVLGFTRIFAKDFDAYYKSLSEAQRQRFELELSNIKSSQNTIMTSEAVVHIDFFVIKALAYENICSMRRQGNMVMLKGDNKVVVVLKQKTSSEVEKMVQEILRHNDKIIQEC